VILSLPNAGDSAVVTIADLRIEDTEAWRDALRAADGSLLDDSQLQLSADEVAAFLATAWQTATEVLPETAAREPDGFLFAWPPLVELRLSADRFDEASRRYLPDLVDLSVFGASDRSQLSEMAVTISGPLRLGQDDRRTRTRQALAHMARGFGFDHVSDSW
jgi:hypothetical protein